MQWLFPLAADTPGMNLFITIVIGIQLISLGILLLGTREYKKMTSRYATLFTTIGGIEEYERTQKTAHVTFWTYITVIITITLVTSILFLFQPHLL